MKSKAKNPRSAKRANLADGGGSGGPTKGWTQRIEPRGAALLSETLGACYFVIKNHGPGSVALVAGHGDLMDLAPGAVRASYAHGTIRVENRSEKSALIEFDFLPINRT